MLRVRETFTFQWYDSDGKSHKDAYEAGSEWITTGYDEDWRQIMQVKSPGCLTLYASRWIPEDMLDKFEEV